MGKAYFKLKLYFTISCIVKQKIKKSFQYFGQLFALECLLLSYCILLTGKESTGQFELHTPSTHDSWFLALPFGVSLLVFGVVVVPLSTRVLIRILCAFSSKYHSYVYLHNTLISIKKDINKIKIKK